MTAREAAQAATGDAANAPFRERPRDAVRAAVQFDSWLAAVGRVRETSAEAVESASGGAAGNCVWAATRLPKPESEDA